jgi:hypothetical protein
MPKLLDRFKPKPPYILLKTGIINLRSGTSFRGVIWQLAGEFVVLRSVEILQDRDHVERHVMDGEVIVKLADIDFVQVTG